MTRGWSSPVIWGDQIWMTTATADGKQMFGICVDRATGKVLHDIKLFEVEEPEFCHAMNSYASPTPVIEEGRVYLHFGTYGTVCLDTATGQNAVDAARPQVQSLGAARPLPRFCTRILLILTFDGYDVQYLAALDKTTGETVWRQDRNIDYPSADGDLRKAYSTPTVVEVNGRAELISPSAEATIAYAPLTGKELWRLKFLRRNEHGGPSALWARFRVHQYRIRWRQNAGRASGWNR